MKEAQDKPFWAKQRFWAFVALGFALIALIVTLWPTPSGAVF